MSDNIHHKCREIMADLGKKGEFEFWDEFEWQPKQKLEKRLKDVLEDEIKRPELTNERMESYTIKSKSIFAERFKIKDLKKDFTANCLDTRNPRDRRTQTFFYWDNIVSYCTPRECFRLQDFPDSFKFVVSSTQLYKQVGNSISVNVMGMIFNQIEKSRHGNINIGSLF